MPGPDEGNSHRSVRFARVRHKQERRFPAAPKSLYDVPGLAEYVRKLRELYPELGLSGVLRLAGLPPDALDKEPQGGGLDD